MSWHVCQFLLLSQTLVNLFQLEIFSWFSVTLFILACFGLRTSSTSRIHHGTWRRSLWSPFPCTLDISGSLLLMSEVCGLVPSDFRSYGVEIIQAVPQNSELPITWWSSAMHWWRLTHSLTHPSGLSSSGLGKAFHLLLIAVVGHPLSWKCHCQKIPECQKNFAFSGMTSRTT